VQQVRIHRPRARREHRWHEVLPPDPRDPDVVRAKALALTGDRAGQTTARQSPSPQPAARKDDDMKQVNLDAMLARFAEHWAPKKIARSTTTTSGL